MTKWTEADNQRRCDLIELEWDTLTADEDSELKSLTDRMLSHRKLHAPLPIKEAKAIRAAMEARGEEQERERFEAWCKNPDLSREPIGSRLLCMDDVDRIYINQQVQYLWQGWQASAAVDRLPPLMDLRQPQTEDTGLGAIVGKWPDGEGEP